MSEVDLNKRVAELERRLNIFNRLGEISASMNAKLQLKPLLAYIMEVAAEIVDSEAASVLLWNRNKNELFFAATSTPPTGKDFVGQPVPLKGSIAGTVLRDKKIEVVNDVTQHPFWFGGTDEDNAFVTRSILAVPMTINERPIGVLEVVNKRELPWQAEDSYYLSILASQAAVAIEVAELVTALRKANDELSQIDKLKNDFIAIASHELRTPLGVIMGYASFLQDNPDAEVSQQAGKVVESAQNLRQLIEDLTNLRYLQQDEIELNLMDTTLEEFVNTAIEDMREFIDSREHQLAIKLPGEIIPLKVDVGRLGMALTNVLNNAVRFTPDGGLITISAESKSTNELWLEVTDSGIGLAADQREQIFERFYQVENHLTRVHGGLGIGLSIARGMVEAHGGRMWCTSPGLNQGTTMHIAIPLGGKPE